jgi:hypothetical protein
MLLTMQSEIIPTDGTCFQKQQFLQGTKFSTLGICRIIEFMFVGNTYTFPYALPTYFYNTILLPCGVFPEVETLS